MSAKEKGEAAASDGRARVAGVTRRSFLGTAAAFSVLPAAADGAGKTRSAGPDQWNLDLSGPWRFRLDPGDEGVAEKWYSRRLRNRIELPGSLQEQGYGNNVSTETEWVARGFGMDMWQDHPIYEEYRRPCNMRVPFTLQPEKHYVGPAWYQRDVSIPAGWQEKCIILVLERCHWKTTLWINGRRIGSRDSLAAPHRYDLTDRLNPGKNRLTLRIDNSMIVQVGQNAHSVSDQTQTAWNGVVGAMKLSALDPVHINDVQVYPDVENNRARVRLTAKNRSGRTVNGVLSVAARSYNTDAEHVVGPHERSVTLDGEQKEVKMDLMMGEDALLWDEFDPALYRLSAELEAEAGGRTWSHRQRTTFGMRNFDTDGTRFAINGRPVTLRGNLECCIFPLTGYPPTNLAAWRRIMRRARAYGLNHLRFHSWCPPEACFRAADEAGMYLQPEVDEWARVETDEQHDFLRRESNRMFREYGNHASLTMMALGNEGYCEPGIMRDLLEQWREDPRRVYTGKSNSNRTVIEPYEFCVAKSWKGEPLRNKTNEGGVEPTSDYDYGAAVEKYPKPLVVHETVQRCSYPDPAWRSKYTGSLRAGYFDIARDQLEKRGMLDRVEDFVQASGRWQVRQFKEEIEAHLRTPGLGGFQLLQLHDFPGQGSALVGVLDAFWDSKGYTDPEEFRRFCDTTVPLARMERFTWTSDETLQADIEVSHSGDRPLRDVTFRCRILDEDEAEVWTTELGPVDVPIANGASVGRMEKDLSDLDAPARYRLVVDIPGTDAENRWSFWVYPARLHVSSPKKLTVARRPEEAEPHLRGGGSVLLLPAKGSLKGHFPDPFRSIYWTSARLDRPFGPGGHTMGFVCDPSHPAFRHFPTDMHCDWQWYELLAGAGVMLLDGHGVQNGWPRQYRPTIQMIDCWKWNRKLAVLAEARVGGGRLAICSMDIENDLENRFVARQFRHSLLSYLESARFEPLQRVSMEQVRGLFREPFILRRIGATASADSYQPGYEPENAIDNRKDTIWHTRWKPDKPGMPHHLTVDLKKRRSVTGVQYLPRQDMANGRIARYEVLAGGEEGGWRKLKSGAWPNDASRKEVTFAEPVRARYVRLRALSEVNGKPFAAAAEVTPLLEEARQGG